MRWALGMKDVTCCAFFAAEIGWSRASIVRVTRAARRNGEATVRSSQARIVQACHAGVLSQASQVLEPTA